MANVTSPPYDVISGGSLAHLQAADPHNVVRLILPGEGPDAPQAAAALLAEWLSAGILIRDRTPALYLYEQSAPASPGQPDGWRQRGIIGLIRIGTPEQAGILPHEGVMPGPVAGRRELMAATQANLEPIFLLYDGAVSTGAAGPTATQIIDCAAASRESLVSIETEDGITHRLWRLDDPAESGAITADLARRHALIADGHHRYAAYLQLQEQWRASGHGPGPWDYGLAFLVDSAACPPRLGAIHRVLPALPQHRAAELAKAAFQVDALPAGTGLRAALDRLAEAGQAGTAFLLAGPAGYQLLSQPDPVQVAVSMPAGTSAAWQSLDASVMQQLLFAKLWGIPDNERDIQVSHDAAEAAAAAGAPGTGNEAPAPGGRGTAVILNPVPSEAVLAIAEHGERVPRKSTSFGPKPRTGLVLRTFRPNRLPPNPGHVAAALGLLVVSVVMTHQTTNVSGR